MADMQAIIAPSYCDPSKYDLAQIPRPAIADPNEVLIQVHAASVNPVDVKVASGLFKLAVKDE
jgi:NADPH:quinone reductase-like Zn-dependent oxidoreductase